MNKLKCMRCVFPKGHPREGQQFEWEPKKEHPLSCPNCKSRNYKEPKQWAMKRVKV